MVQLILCWMGLIFFAALTLATLFGDKAEYLGAGLWILFSVPFGIGIGRFQKTIRAEKQEVVRYNSEDFPNHYRDWESSWLCHKCGYVGKLA